MVREIGVQSQVESYQRLKKWYLMPPCLTLSYIGYVSRVKWSNSEKGVAPSLTIEKGAFGSPSTTVANFNYLLIWFKELIPIQNRHLFTHSYSISVNVWSYLQIFSWFHCNQFDLYSFIELQYSFAYNHLVSSFLTEYCRYLSLPSTRHDLTQGQKPEGRLKWG